MSSVVILFSIFLPVIIFAVEVNTIEIDVAPNVLNTQNEGEVVTVHTDIAYSVVEGASVDLNGLPISWWKSDSQGYFVAKFSMGAVKGLYDSGDLILGFNTLTLNGVTTGGDVFIGAQEIEVKDILPKGK